MRHITMTALHTISSMATRQLLIDLVAGFSRAGGTPVQAEAAGGVDVARRLREGEHFDLVLLADDALQSLAAEGWVQRPQALADSSLALAVPAGHPQPQINTVEAFRAALLAAETIAYSTGPSGQALLHLLEGWGLRETLQPRLRQAPPGVPVATMLVSGVAQLGVQQRSELLGQPGVAVLGDLPAEIAVTTRFSAALGRNAAPASAALLDFLCSREAAATIIRHGMATLKVCK
jgi:molybdate transport system substrate-binding protein